MILRPSRRHAQRGAVAVELAFTLPIFLILLVTVLATGRLLWHYTVAHKAAQDAARYLSTISVQEMRDPGLTPAAVNVARRIAQIELEDLHLEADKLEIDILCGNGNCTGVRSQPLPGNVRVIVRIYFSDVFGFFEFDRYGLPIIALGEMRYAGT